ncbi:MAG TPA: pyridoxamine 5'-phosphate oxidase family protein, partial [Kofleriaceae bacterium]
MASSDIAFSPSVKAVQTRKGSRRAYARVDQRGGWEGTFTAELAAFLADQDSIYLATASAAGQPYIQHRGGPPGFLHVLDDHTLAFADFAGNRQYITTGNLAENPRAHLFAMDYLHRRRIKLWGTARVVEDDPALLARLMPAGYAAKPDVRSRLVLKFNRGLACRRIVIQEARLTSGPALCRASMPRSWTAQEGVDGRDEPGHDAEGVNSMSDLADLFPDLRAEWINTRSGRIFARVGGNGPPLLLLHGFSETHVMWHRVAPQLA